MRLWLIPAALLLAAPSAAQQSAPVTIWYQMTAEDGVPIGHARQDSKTTADGQELVNVQELLLQEASSPVIRVTDETIAKMDRNGRALSISDRSVTGKRMTYTEARILPGRAEVTRTNGADERKYIIPLPEGVRFDSGTALLRVWDPKAMPVLEFRNFSLDALGVERMTIELAPDSRADALSLIRKRYDGTDLRGVARITLRPDRRILAVVQPMFGTSITTKPVDQAAAQAPHRPYRVLSRSLIKSPYRIADAALTGQIRYRFAFRDGIVFTPPETFEQRVRMEDGEVTLDICGTCGPGLRADAETLARALKPTGWLQSDHRKIRAIADPIARLRTTPAQKMELLSRRARETIRTIEFAGHHSALDALASRSGDCTEAAVLLAAFGRAAGIPTLVANGLVYSRPRFHGVSNVFMPHSWVLAHVDGQWRSYDPGLETFDATHIALTIGDGDARSIAAASQLASLLVWQSMAEVRKDDPS